MPTPPPPSLSAPRPARGGGRGVVIAVVALVVVLAVAGTLFLTGVFDRDTDEPGPSGTATQTPDATEAPEDEEVVPGVTVGTPENPYAPGDSFTVMEDWSFTVGATDTDAWPDVASRWDGRPDIDQYQPSPGNVFVMAPASMTYTGPPTDRGRVKGFFVYYVTADGTPLNTGGCGRYGTTFDEFDGSTLEDMPSEEASFCVEALPEQVDGGQWRISMYTYDDAGAEHRLEVHYATS